jgi:hypothetical protein
VTSDVQWGHRVAFSGIDDMQKGQSRVVGAGAGASSFRFSRLRERMRRKTAKATMAKLTIALTKRPRFSVTAPASLAAARLS